MLDVANLVNTQAAGGLTNLFSNTGNLIPPDQTRTFSAAGSFNAAGQEVSGVSFDVLNVIKTSPDVPDPTLSVSGLEVNVTAPAGVQGFDLRAQTTNGRAAIASVIVANPGATSPTLLASLLSPLINGVSSQGGIPSTATGDSLADGSDSGSVPGGSGGGGGGAINLFGLLALIGLMCCFKKQK